MSNDGPDYARLIEQVRSGKILPKNWSGSEEPQKAVSEGSFWPKTWREAVPLVVWGVLVFACGFELVSSTVHSELWPAIYSGIGLVVLLAMLIHGKTFVERLNDLGAWWLVVAVIVLLLVSALSPYIEQRRWPFAWQFDRAPAPPSQIGFTQQQVDEKVAAAIKANEALAPPAKGFTQQQVDEKIEAATASIRLQLNAAIKGQEDLQRENDRLRKLASPTAPPIAALPPAPPAIDAAATLSLIRGLQASYADNLTENNDKAMRYVVITAPPDQIKLRRLLGDIIQLALRPNVAILDPPDPNRELDAPKLPMPDTNGLVTHGLDRLSGVLESVLQQCFMMKRERADPSAGLGEYYYPNQHQIVVWLAFGGVGSPWRNSNGCLQQ